MLVSPRLGNREVEIDLDDFLHSETTRERGVDIAPQADLVLDQPAISKIVLLKDGSTRRIHWVDITPLPREKALDFIHEQGGRALVADGDREDELPGWFDEVDLVELRDEVKAGRAMGRTEGVAPLMEDFSDEDTLVD